MFAATVGRDHVTNFNFIISYYDPINEQFNQLALLFKSGIVQAFWTR